MENKNQNKDLDQLIRASMTMTEVPSPELNRRLKVDLYKQEALLKRQTPTRSISLWYLPMVVNLVTFLLLAALSLVVISNPYLSLLAALVCGHIAIGGVLITVVGVKRANMKEKVAIHIEKRGVLA